MDRASVNPLLLLVLLGVVVWRRESRHSTCDTSWSSRSTDGADWAFCVDD
jgi:hypothetical protein